MAVRFASFVGTTLILLVLFALLAVICAYAVVVLGLERRLVPHELAPRRISGLGPDGTDTRGIVEIMLVAGLGAAVTGELVFRGIGRRLLEEFAGTWVAIMVSGLVFGMIHLTNPDATLWAGNAISIEAGLLLGVLYALTRSLWVVIGYHMLWNIVQGPVLGSPFRAPGTWPRSGVLASRAPNG